MRAEEFKLDDLGLLKCMQLEFWVLGKLFLEIINLFNKIFMIFSR